MPSKTSFLPGGPEALLLIASIGLVVAVSAVLAVHGSGLGINTGFTLLSGALMAVVIVAAVLGYGRRSAWMRVIGLGLVVAAIAVIQLLHLWNDGVAMGAPLAASMLVVLGALGVAGAWAGRRLEASQRGSGRW